MRNELMDWKNIDERIMAAEIFNVVKVSNISLNIDKICRNIIHLQLYAKLNPEEETWLQNIIEIYEPIAKKLFSEGTIFKDPMHSKPGDYSKLKLCANSMGDYYVEGA